MAAMGPPICLRVTCSECHMWRGRSCLLFHAASAAFAGRRTQPPIRSTLESLRGLALRTSACRCAAFGSTHHSQLHRCAGDNCRGHVWAERWTSASRCASVATCCGPCTAGTTPAAPSTSLMCLSTSHGLPSPLFSTCRSGCCPSMKASLRRGRGQTLPPAPAQHPAAKRRHRRRQPRAKARRSEAGRH